MYGNMGSSVDSVERRRRMDTWTYKPILGVDIKPEWSANDIVTGKQIGRANV